MNEFEKIKDIFENAILMDFHKFGILLEESAKRQDIVGCCHDIITLRLKMKYHFKQLADLLDNSISFPTAYSEEEYKQLHAIYEMAFTLLHVPSGYEQTTITDELERITKVFDDADWFVDENRVLPDFDNPALQ